MGKRKSQEVRIIGGKWKGRKLRFQSAPSLRPTLGRLRETLFNWLRPDLCDARCLDLFAGSGILGFEALSLKPHIFYSCTVIEIVELYRSRHY